MADFAGIFIRRYDSEEVRRVARKIDQVEQEVDSLKTGALRNCRGRVSDSFQGEAANALQEQLEGLGVEIDHLREGLDQISNALYAYARKLEETDRRLISLFGGH